MLKNYAREMRRMRPVRSKRKMMKREDSVLLSSLKTSVVNAKKKTESARRKRIVAEKRLLRKMRENDRRESVVKMRSVLDESKRRMNAEPNLMKRSDSDARD